jgi:Ca2+:H+ antiporter
VILLVVYGAYLFFQLKSHVEIYNKPSPKTEKRSAAIAEGDASKGLANIGRMTATVAGQNAAEQIQSDPEDEREQPQLSITVAIITLTISTAFVALCAEYLVCYC